MPGTQHPTYTTAFTPDAAYALGTCSGNSCCHLNQPNGKTAQHKWECQSVYPWFTPTHPGVSKARAHAWVLATREAEYLNSDLDMVEGKIPNAKVFSDIDGFSKYDKRSWICHISTPVLPPLVGKLSLYLFFETKADVAPNLIHVILISIEDIPSNPRKRIISLDGKVRSLSCTHAF